MLWVSSKGPSRLNYLRLVDYHIVFSQRQGLRLTLNELGGIGHLYYCLNVSLVLFETFGLEVSLC